MAAAVSLFIDGKDEDLCVCVWGGRGGVRDDKHTSDRILIATANNIESHTSNDVDFPKDHFQLLLYRTITLPSEIYYNQPWANLRTDGQELDTSSETLLFNTTLAISSLTITLASSSLIITLASSSLTITLASSRLTITLASSSLTITLASSSLIYVPPLFLQQSRKNSISTFR